MARPARKSTDKCPASRGTGEGMDEFDLDEMASMLVEMLTIAPTVAGFKAAGQVPSEPDDKAPLNLLMI